MRCDEIARIITNTAIIGGKEKEKNFSKYFFQSDLFS